MENNEELISTEGMEIKVSLQGNPEIYKMYDSNMNALDAAKDFMRENKITNAKIIAADGSTLKSGDTRKLSVTRALDVVSKSVSMQ